MNSIGTLQDISIDYKSGKPKVTLLLEQRESISSLEEIKEYKLSIEIKKYRKKRSLDANSYCWVLCDMIAKKLTVNDAVVLKEDIYKDAISNIGSFEPMIVEEKAFDNFKRIWEKQGLGFLVKEVSRRDKCIKVFCYYGSSTYDSEEMSLLIELLVEEAKNLGIETKPQAEINSLLESWGEQ